MALPLASQAQTQAQAPAAEAMPAAPSAGPAPATASTGADGATLRSVRVQAGVLNEYKAEKVSSSKFTQPLLETPQTITVIKKELLKDQGASTLSEALRNTPGITFTLGENGNTTTGDSVFMRGFDTSNSIFVDGIRDLGGITRDTFNIEQVEVVKGPSGADNGRGAPTGYINLSSKVPQSTDASSGSVMVGTDSRLRATADLNRVLGNENGTAVRLNLMSDQGDKPGRNTAENKSIGFAPSLAFGLNTPTRAYFSLLHVEQRNLPDGGLPTIGWPGYSYSAATTLTPAQQAAARDAVNGAPRVNTSNYYGASTDYDDVDANMLTARIEHDISPETTLRNTSRYGRIRQQSVLTGVNAMDNITTAAGVVNPSSAWNIARLRQGKDQANEILVNQTNVNTSFKLGGLKNTVSTGVEVMHERQSAGSFTTTGTLDTANLYSPSASDRFSTVVPSGATSTGSTTTLAAYVFDNIELNPQWELNAGLRLERYRTEFSSVAAPAVLPGNTVATQVATNLKGSDQLLNGKLGVVYKPAANGTVYAAYATSQQPPGGANFTLSVAANNIGNPNLGPQKAGTVEVGTKWDVLDNRLVLTAAAYQTTNKNDLAQVDAVTGEVTQFGKRKVKGLEFGASGQITAAWQVSAGLALMDTSVAQGTATQTGSGVNFSPDRSFTGWTTYKLANGLTLGGGGRYLSSQTTAVSNVPVTGLNGIPSYWVFDAMAGYQVSKNVNLQLNLINLSDKVYMASVNNGRSRYTLGQPRMAQLTANISF